jgi:protein involved in polysaccharide export with SLBB domain
MTRGRTGFLGIAAAALGLLLAVPAGAETPLGLDQMQGTRTETAPAIEPRMLASISGPVDPATYIVGPGDVLDLHYSGAYSQSVTLTVSPEGGAFVRGFGTVKLGGLTLEQARRELRRAIGGDLSHGMQVEVELVRARLMHVFLTGEAAVHGPLEIPATARACEALAAESLMTAAASRRNIELRHRDGTRDYADIERYLRLGDLSVNPQLHDDDIVFIPPSRASIEILGAVVHPGPLELGMRDSLRNLVELSGGLLSSSRRDHALFVRFSSPSARESLWISLDDVTAGRFNPPLRDGDRLFVYYLAEYHRLDTASISGEVTIPGVYPLQTGVTRLSDLVRLAGGFQPRADLSAIRVYRPRAAATEPDLELDRLSRLSRNDMTGSEYEVMRTRMALRRVDFRVDWNRLARAPQEDVVLEPGDMVRVEPITLAVRVDGQVRRPGLVRYEPGSSLDRYVSSAGGFSERAATGRVLVTRSVTGQTLRAREVTQLEPGDMIWVPERPERSIWQNIGTLIAVSAQVATLIIAVRR